METGSFIELGFQKGKEYYGFTGNIARLNSGRAAIYHALRLTGCKKIHLPYYQCDTVRDFLARKGCEIGYYRIDSAFNPSELNAGDGEAVLIVNYFGVMSSSRMATLAAKYKNVIIDNSQAFFAPPAENTYSVYSARKFIGVPDGAYVIGKEAQKYTVEYEQGFSSDTSLFLLQRIEYGCEGKAYGQRTLNEKRIDSEDIKLMSKLTRTILDGADYEFIKNKRKENFEYAAKIFEDVNRIDPTAYYDRTCVPMVYPLLCEDENLLPKLIENKHFQGHWWSYLLKEMPEDSFEYYISKYIIPVTIDQRYGKEELNFIRSLVR